MKKLSPLILFILLSGGVAAQSNSKLPANAETFIKNQFKQLFLTKAEDIFNANPDLFKQFDRIGGGKIRNFSEFETLINHQSFDINHPIFNFIKVE